MKLIDMFCIFLIGMNAGSLLLAEDRKAKRMFLVGLILAVVALALPSKAAEGDFAHRIRMEYENTAGAVVAADHGTACAIGPHTLVTAAHVIRPTPGVGDHTKIYIEHEIGWLRCEVTKIDTVNDICLLECKSVVLPYIPINATIHAIRTKVTLWSSILGAKLTALQGNLDRFLEYRKQYFCETEDFDHGGSGSPVVQDNKLVGIAVAGRGDGHGGMAHDTAYVVPASVVQHLIDGAPVILPHSAAEVVELPEEHQYGMVVRKDLSTPDVMVVSPPRAKRDSAIPSPKVDLNPIQPRYVLPVPTERKCVECQRAAVQRSGSRHWDSDADGHGQGGWVED